MRLRIREMLESRKDNASMEQMASEIHFAKRTIQRWDKGSHMPDVLTTLFVAGYFNCTVEELVQV